MTHSQSKLSQQTSGPFHFLNQQHQTISIAPKKCLWNIKENLKFIAVLGKYHRHLSRVGFVHRWTIYKVMAKFVKTKNYTQCRNYHCELMMKYRDFQGVYGHFQGMYVGFHKLFQQHTEYLHKFLEASKHDASHEQPPTLQKHQKFPQKPKQCQTAITSHQYNYSPQKLPQISPKHTFTLKKYHSMPDFYFKYFYPHAGQHEPLSILL